METIIFYDPKPTPEFQAKLAEVEALCETETEGDTNLSDWMAAGNWEEGSASDIAAEWDSLSDD